MAHSRCWGGMHWRTKEWQSSHACQSSGVTREVGEVRSAVAGAKQLDHFVDRTIEDVLLYEDTEIRVVDGEEEHGVAFTNAVVFDLASTRLVFENAFVLDQVIDVYRGPGAEGNLQKPEDGVLACGDIVLSVNGKPYNGPLDGVLAGDEEPDSYRVEREVVSLCEWADGQRG